MEATDAKAVDMTVEVVLPYHIYSAIKSEEGLGWSGNAIPVTKRNGGNMEKKRNPVVVVADKPVVVGPEKPAPTYEAMTKAEVLAAMEQAFAAKDMKLVGRLARLHTEKEVAEEKAARDARQAELDKVVKDTFLKFKALAEELRDSGSLDQAEGVWFGWDFGDTEPTLRLLKSKRVSAEPGHVARSGGYASNPARTNDLLAKYGKDVYLTKDTVVAIDKVQHTIPNGTTFQSAYDYSTNGNWRNRVRMALLVRAELI